MFPSHKSNLHCGGPKWRRVKKTLRVKAKEKKESECRCWPPELLTYVAICVWLLCCRFLSSYQRMAGVLKSAHQTATWGPNCISQGLEWSGALSSLNWWNNESTSIRYLRFKLLMGNCEKRSNEAVEKQKKYWEKKENSLRLGSWLVCMWNLLLPQRIYCKIFSITSFSVVKLDLIMLLIWKKWVVVNNWPLYA